MVSSKTKLRLETKILGYFPNVSKNSQMPWFTPGKWLLLPIFRNTQYKVRSLWLCSYPCNTPHYFLFTLIYNLLLLEIIANNPLLWHKPTITLQVSHDVSQFELSRWWTHLVPTVSSRLLIHTVIAFILLIMVTSLSFGIHSSCIFIYSSQGSDKVT